MTNLLENAPGVEQPAFGDQQPRILWSPPAPTSAGPEVIELAASFGLVLDPWQCLVLTEGLKERSDGLWAAFEVGLMVSRQNGKGDLGHDTPVLTTAGWMNHGDLEPGQHVYGSDGRPVRIVAVSPEYVDSDCYRVTFTDGSSIIAGASHLWPVRHKSKNVVEVLSTEALRPSIGERRPDNGRMEYNWRVRCDAQVDMPHADLPIDPYLLGYWLGDGSADQAVLAVGHQDLEWLVSHLRTRGVNPYAAALKDHGNAWTLRFRIANKGSHSGFRGQAARLGILGDKRIPAIYLAASIEQRKQLLAGLMDSDGSARMNTQSTQVEFCTTIPALAADFQVLVRSLGLRVTPRSGRSGYRDSDGNYVQCRDRYRFLWTPTFNPFQMPRKAALYVDPVSNRQAEMSIISIERVPAGSTRCIQVDTEDGIYLVGRSFIPTHNSILEAIELAGLFLFGERLIIHSAHEFRTAKEAMRRLEYLVDQSGEKFKVTRSHGEESIELLGGPNAGARVMFQTRTKAGGLGMSGDRVILDEAMIIPSAAIQALMPTLSARPNPQIWYTGSAVDQRMHAHCEVFAGVRQRALKGDSPRLCYLDWSCDPGADPESLRERARANPGMGYRITPEYIQDEFDAFEGMGDIRAFGVQRLGIGDWPVLGAARSAIPAEKWQAMRNPLPTLAGPRVVTLYRAPDGGPWAVVAAQRVEDGRIHVEVGHVGMAPVDEVARKVVDVVAAWDPAALLVGRGGAAEVLPELEAVGIEAMVPSIAEEAQACGGFLNDAIADAFPPLLSHGDQAGLNDAVANAARRNLPSGGFVWDAANGAAFVQLMGASLSRWALLKFAAPVEPLIHEWPSDAELRQWLEEEDDLIEE